jgi:iron complex transport system ATP-binding protein
VRLKLEQVTITRRGRRLLDDVSLALEAGELLALVGPNGAGKTTLLRAMLGLIRPDGGRVLLDRDRVDELEPRARAACVAWLPQHSAAAEELSALEVVTAARFRFDESFAVSCREAARALERVGVGGGVSERPLRTLSGGERQRVALAGLLAQAAPLLLVDEPANHLDPAQQIEVYRLLGELWREGKGLVCVTHDVNLLRHLGDPDRVRVAGISAGQLRFEHTFGAPELPARLSSLFDVQMRAFELDGSRVLIAERRS